MSVLHNYALHQSSEEVHRLDIQHRYFQTAFGYRQGVSLPLNPSQADTILDIAAGTGAWILDVARNPVIASRLTSPTDKFQLLACDLSLAKFSPALTSSISNAKIKVFEQDVTQPFPKELHGTVDVAHMSLLVWALTRQGWERALRNIYDVLKPGGRLILMEMDLTFYDAGSQPSISIDQLQNYISTAKNGSTTLDKINTLFASQIMRNDRVLGLSLHIPTILKSASFSLVHTKSVKAPVGRLCTTFTGLDGSSLAEYAEFMTENLEQISETLFQKVTPPDVLGSHLKITKEEEKKVFIDEFLRFSRTEGMYSVTTEWVAEKVA